eukprot:CAMPEP_0171433306 /NCGR_PEP_ID=MMETSP0881-20121228/8450_1 /TAXON_ID=67004 /ORGANISM="Thalassiosira weissflogii, Strain CCMP1336" /LENGTH=75 /DNA_ID=CAMNT_0011953867 /DNA_START=56 /DNA_END=280 /DNA_ORIENTATION=+
MAEALTQRMPPVQYMRTFLFRRVEEKREQKVESKWEKVTVLGLRAGVGSTVPEFGCRFRCVVSSPGVASTFSSSM